VLFFYTVKEGDTLESIADRFSVPLDILLAINDFSSDEIVYPGMTIIVPLLERENGGQPQGHGPSTDGGEGDRGRERGPPER
jgi:LysM repeat protein